MGPNNDIGMAHSIDSATTINIQENSISNTFPNIQIMKGLVVSQASGELPSLYKKKVTEDSPIVLCCKGQSIFNGFP